MAIPDDDITTDAPAPEPAPKATKGKKAPEPEPVVEAAPEPEVEPGPVPPDPEPPPAQIAVKGARLTRNGRPWVVQPWGVYTGDDAAWLLANAPDIVETFDISKHG